MSVWSMPHMKKVGCSRVANALNFRGEFWWGEMLIVLEIFLSDSDFACLTLKTVSTLVF